jgi:uncharacterized protein (DUF4415 family)
MSVSNMNKSSKTNWAKVDNLADKDIDTSDSPELDSAFFEHASVRLPSQKAVMLHVDADVLEWFRAQTAYEARINAALKLYAEAHKPQVR